MICELINETDLEVPEKIIKKCVRDTLKRYPEVKKDFFCTIVFAPEDKIRKLNEKYYGKEGPTDVLTFGSDQEDYAGDIIICPSFIKKNNPGKDKYIWEICHVAVHGTFHLLGIHHEDSDEDHKKLHKQEKEIINNILK